MAGKDDKAKKRKRDAAEAVARSKRHRTEKKDQKKSSRRDSSALTNGKTTTVEGRQDDGPRELELNREFDNGEAGWRVSKPIGGRMLDIDAILTDDEQYAAQREETRIRADNLQALDCGLPHFNPGLFGCRFPPRSPHPDNYAELLQIGRAHV